MNKTALMPVLVFLCFLLLLPAGCGLWPRGEQSSPQAVMQAYLEAFKVRDLEAMYRLSAGEAGGEEELEFARKFMEMIELQNYEIGPVDAVSENEVLVEVSVSMVLLGREMTQSTRVRVIKQEGKWQVKEGLLE